MASSKFHLSLNVKDLRATASFLELLLGTKPTQLHANYAKFEVLDPPLVLSLVPTELPTTSGINHLGFRLPNRESLDAMQHRLQNAGVAHEIEESVACCHSRQSKFWVHDPAGNLWEFYVLEDSQTCDTKPDATSTGVNLEPKQDTESVWGHRLDDPIPECIPAESGSLDKVVLEGTLNSQLTEDQATVILSEAARALRAGGRLVLHGLTGDRPLIAAPALPGPAARVKHVPTHREVLDAVESAGFVGIELLTFGETYSFSHAGSELRELKLHAIRGNAEAVADGHIAIYRGPFAEVRDDSGHVFRRGERVSVDPVTRSRLGDSPLAAQFVFERLNRQDSDRIATTIARVFEPESISRP